MELPTGTIVVEREWTFLGRRHLGSDLACFTVLMSMRDQYPHLVNPHPRDRREMFARLVRLNGALSAAGPWLEEYVRAVIAPIHPTDPRLDKVAKFARICRRSSSGAMAAPV